MPIPGKVQVTGVLAPTDVADTFPVTDPQYGLGALRTVMDDTALNAITTQRRQQGMLVYVVADLVYYMLNAPPWDGTLLDWTAIAFGGTPGGSPGDLQFNDGSGGFAGGGPTWNGEMVVIPGVAQITGNLLAVNATFTGVVTAPTPNVTDNSTTVATTAFVKANAPVPITPGGATGDLQWNNAGIFAGGGPTWDSTTFVVTGNTRITGNLNVGGFPMGTMAIQSAGAVAITGGTITGLPTPTSGSDAANKSYVDAAVTQLSAKASCRLATAANLLATYNNGSSGVGATLINADVLGSLIIDSVAVSINNRILVKNQAAPSQNGIYFVTTVGDSSTPWVLTRGTDYDSPQEVTGGTYVVIREGTINAGTLWIETGMGPFTIGATPVVFTQLDVGPVTTTFTGDVSGTGSGNIAITVTGLKMAPLGLTNPIAGNVLLGDGSKWNSSALCAGSTGDLQWNNNGLLAGGGPRWNGTTLTATSFTGNVSGNATSITGTITENQVTNLSSDLATLTSSVSTRALDSTVVHLTGIESISGLKTFTSLTTMSAASLAVHYGAWTTETDASTVTLDLNVTDKHTLTATTGVGLSRIIAFANFKVGQVLLLEFIQAATGGPYTLTFSSPIRWANSTAPATSPNANKADLITVVMRSDGTLTGALSIPNY